MNELEDLLKRSDLLKSWDYGYVTRLPSRTRVDFAARIAVRKDAHASPAVYISPMPMLNSCLKRVKAIASRQY